MEGIVLKSTGSWYLIKAGDGNLYHGRLRGKFKKEDTRFTNPVTIGDRVTFEPETYQHTAWITEIHERKNYICRKSVHKTKQKHIIAANLDHAVLMCTVIYPETSLGFIDRFIVSAEAFRIPVTLLFNKSDLYDHKAMETYMHIERIYTSLGYTTRLISTTTEENIAAIRPVFEGKCNLLAGHSGVGKSTLLNMLVPGLHLSTAPVSKTIKKGRHTTTFAEMHEIDDNTYIIDTPGIKEFGLADIGEDELGHYFVEMRQRLGQCRFNDCRHIHEPGCVIREAVESNEIAPERYNSYLSMMEDHDNRR